MEPASAVLAAAAAKDTTLSTLSKLLSPPEVGDGGPSDSDADDTEAHLEPFAADHEPSAATAAPSSRAGPQEPAQKTAAPLMEEQRRLQALLQSTVLPRPQVKPAAQAALHQEYCFYG